MSTSLSLCAVKKLPSVVEQCESQPRSEHVHLLPYLQVLVATPLEIPGTWEQATETALHIF